jgi:methylase of polypeptide subunit release factors
MTPLDMATGALQRRVVQHLLAQAAAAATARDRRRALLQAAHVAAQSRLRPHVGVHITMLRVAAQERNLREVAAQCVRLALTPLGHLTGRLPWGNPGSGDVDAFAPMELRPETEALIRQALRTLATEVPR